MAAKPKVILSGLGLRYLANAYAEEIATKYFEIIRLEDFNTNMAQHQDVVGIIQTFGGFYVSKEDIVLVF